MIANALAFLANSDNENEIEKLYGIKNRRSIASVPTN
jgi:hypothetical protein